MGFGGLGGDWGGVQMICQCQTPNLRMPKGSFVEEKAAQLVVFGERISRSRRSTDPT